MVYIYLIILFLQTQMQDPTSKIIKQLSECKEGHEVKEQIQDLDVNNIEMYRIKKVILKSQISNASVLMYLFGFQDLELIIQSITPKMPKYSNEFIAEILTRLLKEMGTEIELNRAEIRLLLSLDDRGLNTYNYPSLHIMYIIRFIFSEIIEQLCFPIWLNGTIYHLI